MGNTLQHVLFLLFEPLREIEGRIGAFFLRVLDDFDPTVSMKDCGADSLIAICAARPRIHKDLELPIRNVITWP